MNRLHPRIRTRIPAEINLRSQKIDVEITDISTDGAFFKGQMRMPKNVSKGSHVSIKYSIPGQNTFEHNGRIVRQKKGGLGVDFSSFDITLKTRLWNYISENLRNTDTCPYCGEHYDSMPPVCDACGWQLSFQRPEYFKYHEKTYLLKKLNSISAELEDDQIRRTINFMNHDILKNEDSEVFDEFVASSNTMLNVFSNIRKVAPTDVSVLILGESGTGKELVAHAIHERSLRKDEKFLTINCAAIPEALLESELFGYEKGAFTGAYTSKKGKFELVDGGTLFLDEIGELPLSLQSKLLRFLEDKVVERIGGLKGKKVDVRLLSATNHKLEEEMKKKESKFRPDLYYRLNGFTINLLPVRERGEDKVLLAKYFLKRFSMETGTPKKFSEQALNAIRLYPWPGNVREIINVIRKAVILASGDTLGEEDIGLEISDSPAGKPASLTEVRESSEKERIKEALDRCGNNISMTAKDLGISRPTIYAFLKKYSIYFPKSTKRSSKN